MNFFFDNLNEHSINQYRERTKRAINGIDMLLQDIGKLVSCGNIRSKYMMIAKYLGLDGENGISFYNFFVPINADIVILIRESLHDNTNPYLYNTHEVNGRPNKRYIIVFSGNIFSAQEPTTFLESEHHVINYPVNALDDENSAIQYLTILKQLLITGDAEFQQLP